MEFMSNSDFVAAFQGDGIFFETIHTLRPEPEPKPRSLVWWWLDLWREFTDCSLATFEKIGGDMQSIPARMIDGELEPVPTVAEARARKEAELLKEAPK